MRSRRHGEQDGFSVVEMMMVLLIIGILLGIAFVSYSFSLDRTRQTACRANLKTIREAIRMYEAKNGAYPPSLRDLAPEYLEGGFDFRCPRSGQDYLYDPLEGEVRCPYHQDL
ncbi:MAG: prepilin-type N-terminal cleavage/methylation domain-containing protein [Actinomycetota bacterium]|nr:prepilin-type N-terminal cleavage/methylation domain-containing protein [Actinomycetota bacterium]